MPAMNDTAYGPAFFATALSASLLLVIAAITLGAAIARSRPDLRSHGIAYAALLPLFVVSGFAFPPVQAFFGFAFALATAALAVRLTRSPTAPAPRPAASTTPFDVRW